MNKIVLPQKQKGKFYLSPHAETIEVQAPQLICQSNTETIKPGTETGWVMGGGHSNGLF